MLTRFKHRQVTLGKPLRFDHTFVFRRDTLLLAPAGAFSLEKIGALYKQDGDFNKRVRKSEEEK